MNIESLLVFNGSQFTYYRNEKKTAAAAAENQSETKSHKIFSQVYPNIEHLNDFIKKSTHIHVSL